MKDQIKKMLYKQKPTAELFAVGAENAVMYTCKLESDKHEVLTVEFIIPKNEHTFEDEVPAHLLCRWIKAVEFN